MGVIRAKFKIFNDNPFHVWVTYVYGTLISWIVLSCQLSVVWADYYQPFEDADKYWIFGNNDIQKTSKNLMNASLMIGITFICNSIIYLMTFNAQIKNLKSYTNKIDGIKNEYRTQDQDFVNDFVVENKMGLNDQSRKNSIFLALKDDDDDHDGAHVMLYKDNATGLGSYIPFHRWYYAAICSLVAIKCTQIIFTDLYNYFV